MKTMNPPVEAHGPNEMEEEASSNVELVEEMITYHPVPATNSPERRYTESNRSQSEPYSPESLRIAKAIVASSLEIDSLTVEDATIAHDSAQWKKAINSEFTSLRQHGTWKFVKKPEGIKYIQTKLLFNLKMDATSNLVRHKVCLVAKG